LITVFFIFHTLRPMGSLYGYEVQSELPLRRLNAGGGDRGLLRVEAADGELREPQREPEGVLEDERGRRWYASYEEDGECLLVLPPTGAFMLEPAAGRVTVDFRDSDEELLEHRLASSAICTLLALRGDLVLHAGAVEVNGRALIFCGPTTRGKSTLVRVLGESGQPILGEDGIAISLEGEPHAFPGARGVRVRNGDARGVTLVPDPGPRPPQASAVAAVVLLEERGAELSLRRLERAEALTRLTPNLVHSGATGSIGAAFGRLARLLGGVPAYSASLPDDLGALPEAAKSLLAKLRASG
jgi:hypothetical protein